MKSPIFLRTLLVAASVLAAPVAHAASLYWDGTDTTVNADGSTGTWDTALANWDSLATAGVDSVWNNATPDSAIFGGTGGTVSLGTAITTRNVTINSGSTGYIIQTNALTLSGASAGATTLNINETATINSAIALANAQVFNVAAGKTLTLGGVISGAQTLTYGGAGTYLLTAANSNSGNLTIDAATVSVASGAALFGTGLQDKRQVTIQNGGTLVATNYSVFWGGIYDYATNIVFATGGGTFQMTGSGDMGEQNKGFTVNSGVTANFKVATGTSASWSGAYGGRDFTVNGTLNFNGGGNFTTSRFISGTGSVTKSDAGTLTLSATNTFTGKILSTAGLILASTDRGFGGVPGSVVADQITLNGGGIGFSAAGQTLSANRGITLGASGGTIDTSALASTSTSTFSSVITGTGALTLKGNGNTLNNGGGDGGLGIKLNAVNTFTGNITISSGLVSYAADTAFGNAANTITLSGGGLLDPTTGIVLARNIVAAAGTTSFIRLYGGATPTWSGAFSGTGTINRTDGGTLTLTGSMAGFGGTFALVSTGTNLTLNNSSAAVTTIGGAYSVVSGAALTVNTTAVSQTLAGVISGTGSLTKTGSNTLTLSGTNTFTGGIQVAAGTLQASTTAALNGQAIGISAGGTLLLDNTYGVSFANTFTGTGLIKVNYSANTAASGSSYTGIGGFAGTLQLATLGATGDKGFSAGMTAANLTLQVDSGATFYNYGAVTLKQINITGAGNSEGRGALRIGSTLTATNGVTLLGDSQISFESGTLAGTVTSGVAGTQTLTLGGTGATGGTISGSIGGGTGTINLSVLSSTYTLSGANTYTGTTTLASGATLVLSSASNQTLAGVISGAGTLRKTGAGTLTLTGNNAFDGGVQSNGGTVQIASLTSLGSGYLGMSNSTLTYTGTGTETTNRALWIDTGTGTFNIVDSAANISFTGTGGDIAYNITKTGAGALTLAKEIRGAATTVTVSGGTLTLTTANTGFSVINAGTLAYVMGSGTTLSLPSTKISGAGNFSATAGVLQVNGNITVGGSINLAQAYGTGVVYTGIELVGAASTLTGSSITLSGDVGTRGANGKTLTLDTSATGGTINLNVSLARSGVWYSPASFTANAGSGTINVTGTGPASSGWASAVTLTGGVVNISSNVVGGSVVTINNASASSTASVFSGGMSLVKGGAGTLTLSAVNTFSGALTVNSGTLVAAATTTSGNASATGNNNTITVNSGAVLRYTASRGAGYHQANAAINGGTITFDADDMSFAVGSNITFGTSAGTINGTGQLRRRNAGNKITVTAAASGSTVSVGELNLLDSTPQFDIADGASAADLTVSSMLTGGAGINKYSAGTLVLSSTAAGSNVGAITIGAGTLEITGQIGSSTTGTYTSSISNSGVLKVNSASNQSMSGVISGAGALSKSGNGTLTLSGANTFSGGLTVSAGTIVAGSTNALGVGTVSIGGGTLNLGSFNIANTIVFTGSGTLTNYSYWNGALNIGYNISGSALEAAMTTYDKFSANIVAGTVSLTGLTKDLVINGGSVSDVSAYTGKLTIQSAINLSTASTVGALQLETGGSINYGSRASTDTIQYVGGSLTNAGSYTGDLNVVGTSLALTAGNLGAGRVVVGTDTSVSIGSGLTNAIRLTGGSITGSTLNNYNGTVTVASGQTLDLDGASNNLTIINTSANISLETGATLKGNATVGAITVQSGGILAPGNSPGQITASSLTLNGNSSMNFEVAASTDFWGATSATAGTDYDTIVVTGLLDLSALSFESRFNLNLLSVGDGIYGDPHGWDANTPASFVLFSYGSLTLAENESITSIFSINTTGFYGTDGLQVLANHFSISNDIENTRIMLNYSAVPEPSTYGIILGGLALAAAAIRRRKQMRA